MTLDEEVFIYHVIGATDKHGRTKPPFYEVTSPNTKNPKEIQKVEGVAHYAKKPFPSATYVFVGSYEERKKFNEVLEEYK